jgi:hypothetical protein
LHHPTVLLAVQVITHIFDLFRSVPSQAHHTHIRNSSLNLRPHRRLIITTPSHLDLAHSWFKFVEKGDTDGLASILSDNLTHRLLPASMQLPEAMEHPFDKKRHLNVY